MRGLDGSILLYEKAPGSSLTSAAASGSPVIHEELALYGTILTPARLNKLERYLLPGKTWNFQEIIFLLLTIRDFHGILSLREILGNLLLNINSVSF